MPFLTVVGSSSGDMDSGVDQVWMLGFRAWFGGLVVFGRVLQHLGFDSPLGSLVSLTL